MSSPERKVAISLKACLELCRAGNLPTVWTNVLAAGVLAAGRFPAVEFFASAASMSFFYMGGMVLNDVCDRERDRSDKPFRPLPSRRVSVAVAKGLSALLFAAGVLPLLLPPFRKALPAAIVLLLAVIAYDLRHKDNRFSPLLMALCRFLIFPATALAAVGEIRSPVLIAGGVQFGYILLVSLVARYENRRPEPLPFPVMPYLLAGISLVDGLVLAAAVHPGWFAAGMAGGFATLGGQRLARGD